MNRHEEEVVRAVCEQVRLLSLQQIATTWWSDTRWGRSRGAAAMRRLSDEGWLHMQRVIARPSPPLAAPLVEWLPGGRRPDLVAAARRLHSRAMADARPVDVVFATSKSVRLLASGRAPSVKLTQATHDLSVGSLYLRYRRLGQAAFWLSEDRLPRDWPIRQRVDAVLRDKQRRIVRAVEYGGDYPVERLAELHEGMASIPLAYELW